MLDTTIRSFYDKKQFMYKLFFLFCVKKCQFFMFLLDVKLFITWLKKNIKVVIIIMISCIHLSKVLNGGDFL